MCYNGFVDRRTDRPVPPQVMALRHAAPKTSSRSPAPPRSPIDKQRLLPSPSESTLPQLLIPRDFNSCISNVYKKPQGGGAASSPKFVNSLPPLSAPVAHTRMAHNLNPLYVLLHGSLYTEELATRPSQWASRPGRLSSAFHGSRITTMVHDAWATLPAPPVPLRRNPQSARITAVTASRHPGNISAPRGV
jgi:hypothetical protein